MNQQPSLHPPRKLCLQSFRNIDLGEYHMLEIIRSKSKVLVSVSRVAVYAVKLASTIRTQRPLKGEKTDIDSMEDPLTSDGNYLDSDYSLLRIRI